MADSPSILDMSKNKVKRSFLTPQTTAHHGDKPVREGQPVTYQVCLTCLNNNGTKGLKVVEVRSWHGVCVLHTRLRTLVVGKSSLVFVRFCQRRFIDHFSKEKEIE